MADFDEVGVGQAELISTGHTDDVEHLEVVVGKRQHAEALLQRGRRHGPDVVADPGPRSFALERGVRGVLGHLASGS